MAYKIKRRSYKAPLQRPLGIQDGRPVVAIVGRPNVGKSALFNRLSNSRIAIVEDTPGVTRDRIYADVISENHEYILLDTGGFDPDSDDPLTQNIASQVKMALCEADLIICMYDGTVDPLPADREATRLLRETNKPVIYVANKIDSPKLVIEAMELYSLGINPLYMVSALHGHGMSELESAICAALPETKQTHSSTDSSLTRIAIVGRPNAGKSSLVNRLLGKNRQIVDHRPGTTIDSIDTLLSWSDRSYVLIDTAGIRRQRSIKRGVESLSVLSAIRAIERSHLVVLLLDASQGAYEQDTKIAGIALERGRALAIALNKVDLLSNEQIYKVEQQARDVLCFATWAPTRKISALTGQGIDHLMKTVALCDHTHSKRVPTGEVNRFFDEVLAHHPPPTVNGKLVKLYYITQVSVRPPSFTVISNRPDKIHFSYHRYIVNQLRKRFGFQGTPVRIFFRPRK